MSAVTTTPAGVRATPYAAGDGLPLFLEPVEEQLATSLAAFDAWFQRHREVVDDLTSAVGALVLRGFPVATTEVFDRLVRHYDAPEFGYAAGATPRSRIEGRVFEATRAPAQHKLNLHQEMAYLPVYPTRLAFYCHAAPDSGGETIICDMRKVTAAVDPAFFGRVRERGVRYTRNFRNPDWSSGDKTLDTYHRPWTEAFMTEETRAAEQQCAAMGLEWEWIDGSMSVSHRAPGWVRHPRTGEEVWFNQIATQSLTVENIGQDRLDLYRQAYGDRPLPYRTTFGDGSPIATEDVSSLYPILDANTVAFPWRQGDVMFVDNFCTAHGRNPFTGHRDVQVALLDQAGS